MDDLLTFLDELESDENLKQKFLEADSLDEICTFAKIYGYYFTVEELEEYYMRQVSGGSFVHNESETGTISQYVEGDGNVVMNYGDVTVAKGGVNGTQKVQVDPIAVLRTLLGKE